MKQSEKNTTAGAAASASASAVADASASACSCRHCGGPSEQGEFCSQGCAYAHRLLVENRWEKFYNIRDRVIAPVGDAAFVAENYEWLQSAQEQAERGAGQSGACQLTLALQGASCAACVWLLQKVYAEHCGEGNIDIDLSVARLHLHWRAGAFDLPGFARAAQAFGYSVGLVSMQAEGDLAASRSRRMLKQLALCVAFQMNVMLYTLPSYFGMDLSFSYARLFHTMAMVFATLSLWAGGMYFIRRAWQALRRGEVSLDLPLALGICGSYVGSMVGWAMWREEYMYFDFVSTFILLMLFGRWVKELTLERNRRRLDALQPVAEFVRLAGRGNVASGVAGDVGNAGSEAGSVAKAASACGLKNGNDLGRHDGLKNNGDLENADSCVEGERIAREQLLRGHRFFVESSQRVPVEAVLQEAEASFDLAWINGEPEPRTFCAGQPVPAGARYLGLGRICLEAREAWGESMLAALLARVKRAQFRNRVIERVVRGYLIGIIVTAFVAGIVWLFFASAWQAGAVVTAVLVVSCPCALGLAFPLADELAIIALRRLGVFIRSDDLWDRLPRIRRIVFDKTGTLTLETPSLLNPQAVAALATEPQALQALHALVRENPHPVARSLYRELLVRGVGDALPGAVEEAVGCGVSLGPWSLGRGGWKGGNPGLGATVFCFDGQVLAQFTFAENVRADVRRELGMLAAAGFSCDIISGDSPEKVTSLVERLGLPLAAAHGGFTPEQKAQWVQTQGAGTVLMIGDGANDSLAFDKALCRGTPVVYRGILERKSDFYYVGQGIAGIRSLFAVNRARHWTQQWLLAFMIAYNLLAVGAACAGWINPLVAAILMPLSSLATLAIVALGMRSVWNR